MGLIDVLFPKRCVNCRILGSYLCATCLTYLSFDPERICLMCNRPALDGLTHPGCSRQQGIDGSFSALAYNHVMKRLLFSFKYQPYISDLRTVLGELFYEGIIQNEQFMARVGKDTLLIPIPLHSGKRRKRGYNHARLLAEEIERKIEPKVMDVLIRTRKTKSQYLLKKDERAVNVQDAFALEKVPKERLKNVRVFLVDDVVTTGATMREAARVLKKAGVKEVYSLTLAHGQ